MSNQAESLLDIAIGSDRSGPPWRGKIAIALVWIGMGATIAWSTFLAWTSVRLAVSFL